MFVFCIGSVHLFTESFVSCLLPFDTRQLLVPVPPESWVFKMASLCYFLVLFHGSALFAISVCNSDSISSLLIFPLLLTIADSEIGKKKHEEDLKQIRRDRPIFNKKVGNYDKCQFSNFFLFQRAKMIISVSIKWMIVDCNLAVRFLLSFQLCATINSKTTDFWFACRH